ncbi:MAG: CheY-like chemotaxis protein/anti-sigma regulatory factor (Ser/Thr protein kinase) [Flavobacteriales bacterium]
MKVLVVDDHGYNRDLLAFILEDHEHEVVQAANGQEACEVIASDQDVNIILMDVMMPVMDGIEATKAIKSSIGDRFLPIVFVTALDDTEMLTRCLDSGGDDFVPKPVNEGVLVARLNVLERTKNLYDNLMMANDKLTYHSKMMDREHAIIEHIFKNCDKSIQTYCKNVNSYTSPMSMFNGDLAVVVPSPTGGVYCMVGDFTGHGLAASIGTLPLMELFTQNVARKASVSQIASEINARLLDLLPSNMFFCAAIFEVDRNGETLTLWLGGMNDALAISPNGVPLKRIESAHMPLGILDREEFDDSPSVFNFKPGTRLYFYTDGIVEANDLSGEEFGQIKFEKTVSEYSENTIDRIIEAVHEFQGSTEQSDDVTILELTTGPIVHVSKEGGEVVDVGAEYHRAESIPWSLNVELRDDDLKNTDVVNQVMSFVSSIKGIELHQDKIFTIISELYSNALEHGVLGLESSLKASADGFEKYYGLRAERLASLKNQLIKIDFVYIQGDVNKLRLEITDSGEGFDVDAKKEQQATDELAHGRGINLLSSLCSSLEYANQGRTVIAHYDLCYH